MIPKFLIGESYGGTRGAALADYLQQRFGMFLNGVMLVAPALNMEALFDGEHSNLPHPLFLPLYAATAHYHGLLGDRTLDDVVAEARDWADTYRSVLARGAATRRRARRRRHEDRVPDRAQRGLRRPRQPAARAHPRLRGAAAPQAAWSPAASTPASPGPADHYIHEQMPYDPFMSATSGPYTAALHHYLRGELEYENDAIYEVLSRQVHPWSYKEFEGQAVDVADKLATAMIINPHLQVHIAMGRYDGGVPVEAIEYSLDQMAIPASYRDRIETRVYPAGHMMYIHQESRVAQAADLADFVRRASNRA